MEISPLLVRFSTPEPPPQPAPGRHHAASVLFRMPDGLVIQMGVMETKERRIAAT
jgi:hypothetical protein